MRYVEFATRLDEQAPNAEVAQPLDKNTVIAGLNKIGFTDLKPSGNKLFILIEIPEGEAKNAYRVQTMQTALAGLQQLFPQSKPKIIQSSSLGSLGGIAFENSPIEVGVKDKKVQGGGSSGKVNETNLVEMLYGLIQTYGTINVTFVDSRGKTLGIKNCDNVQDASLNVVGRKKADIVLSSSSGSLPISLKQVNADQWESADSLFGERARTILSDLQSQGIVKLDKRQDDKGRKYFHLTKEIVVEPTPEEAMNAIFGNDLFNEGGVVIQTFKDEHFKTIGNNVTIECNSVIRQMEDIPESHLMVWIIRNNVDRNNPLPGLRTLGVTLTRGIGTKGTKDVILVDMNGNVVQNPNIK
jgi:hypothetical protein